jgi:hypothetical protein
MFRFSIVSQSEILSTCLEPEEVEALALEITCKHFFANEFIVRPKSFASSMFYLMNGSVDVSSP